MATNHERVGKALDLLKDGLGPFIEREFTHTYEAKAQPQALMYLGDDRLVGDKPVTEWDAAALLRLMWNAWNDVFRNTLGQSERTLVSELRGQRNEWAHQQTFSSDDTYRMLDSAGRLLAAVSAPQSDEIEKTKMELLRIRYDEQVRYEKRKTTKIAVETAVTGTLKPWREVVTPHQDVASGRYQQAEFAADLWQVHIGEGTDEYRDPTEFFRRTYLTESLKRLLVGSLQRVVGQGGDPVVDLQTNFGGGKTHSMLALYHLFSGTPLSELAGIDVVMQEAGVNNIPSINRVVLVGNKISPGNPVTKPDGSVVRTLWGEMAWQLGGKKALKRVRADDEKATSPGDVIRELFNTYGPCLILIDEWVAYARQLHDQSDLPAGSFETQFTFAQALTEAAKAAKNCLLVISLPASDSPGSPHTHAEDVEVGGQRGREALDRLQNVIARVESSWRPASAEEGFEIVRRRLFEPLIDPVQFTERDVVARAYAEFYRAQHQEFPPECREADYEKRIRAAYPIHPEVFDRLYNDWSSLVKFQRTRGVLRLMAAVIHSLWEQGDRNALIQPGHILIDNQRVQFELTRYLSDNWVPIIEKDIAGPNSLPLRLDEEQPNLGKYHATRRVARTIYLGSAPTTAAANRGLEDRRVKLGCVMPGESPAVFGDALRRLAASATYLYQDGPRYWYSTQPTVTKLAEDRAAQLTRDLDKVTQEIDGRLRADLSKTGTFSRVHPLPGSSADVPDDLDARLVVLGTQNVYSKDSGNAAQKAAQAILETRGNIPRLYRNTLVFLAADQTRLQDLDEAARKYLAWESILGEKELLDLSPNQVKQAETQKSAADGAVTARLPEVYQWLLVPIQDTPQAAVEWQAIRLSGQDALAVRAAKKLERDELLITSLGGVRLRMELDRVPLWRGDHVAVGQVVDDFGRYLYLPRVQDSTVLLDAMGTGVGLLTWRQDSFAYAETYDESASRYRGLHAGQNIAITNSDSGFIVQSDVARQQMDEESQEAEPPIGGGPGEDNGDTENGTSDPQPPTQPKRYHGTITLDPERAGRDASRIADEVITHLAGLVGASVRITLEIEADIPDGAPEHVVRTVTENSRTLKFTSHGFEKE